MAQPGGVGSSGGSSRSPQDRLSALLDAVHDLGADRELHAALARIVKLACDVSQARYGALGVLDTAHPERLARFITHGMDPDQLARIERPPQGLGLLGRLIHDPRPVRLENLAAAPDAVGFPPGHPPMHRFLGVPVRTGSQVFGNLYLTEKAGGAPFTDEDEQLVQALATVAGAVVEAAQQGAVTAVQREVLTSVHRIHEAARASVDLEVTLPLLTERVLDLTGGVAAAVVRAGEDGRVEVMASAGETTAEVLLDLDAATRQAVEEQRSLVVVHDLDDVRIDAAPRHRRTSLHPVVTSNGDRVVLVAASWAPTEGVTDQQVSELLETFAVQLSLLLDRAHAERDREMLTLLGDRDRIARDLHDLVIQRLFAVGLQLQGASRMTDRPAVAERLQSAVTELDATIRDIRGTIFELQRRPGQGSLREDLRALVDGYAATLGFAPSTHLRGPLDTALDDETQMHLLAVLREALSNVARHAGAGSAVVEVGVDASGLVARVVDDGVGVPAQVRESGLRNLRSRAQARGGTLTVEPREPRGTALTWRVPSGPDAARPATEPPSWS